MTSPPGSAGQATLGTRADEAAASWALGAWPGANVTDAREATPGGSGIVVAVLDSGVDARHPDLPRVAPGWDPDAGDAIPEDDCGHGTKVAGILAASPGDQVGTTGITDATVLPVKVLADGQAGCRGSMSALADGVRWAAKAGADVIAIPLGCAAPCWDADVAAAVSHARSLGALVVASAGNAPSQGVYFPASTPDALAVGALDRDGQPAYGAFAEGRPDLLAPGVGLRTIQAGGGDARLSGASAAVPVVAGAAALILSEADLSPDAVARLLQGTARDVGATPAAQGDGAVDAGAALEQAEQGIPEDAAGLAGSGPTAQGDGYDPRVLTIP